MGSSEGGRRESNDGRSLVGMFQAQEREGGEDARQGKRREWCLEGKEGGEEEERRSSERGTHPVVRVGRRKENYSLYSIK